MGRVTVRAGGGYPVLIAPGALQSLVDQIAELRVSGVVVVTDRTVKRLWAEPLLQALSGAGMAAPVLALEPGEAAKTYASLRRVLGFLEDCSLDRRGLVIALGGGTVGDAAGFAAAVWLRGVRWLGVPTTLLGMVDSSVGGKTGINTERTKNGVGAFWQPAGVLADLATLATLPEGEVASAFAEVVKYGVAMDAELVAHLEQDVTRLRALEPAALEAVVQRCVELKAAVVEKDEREHGGRAILNYGHTVGHGIEAASGYQAVHGRAVAQGMRVAARLAVRLGLCDEDVVGRQEALLDAFALPGALPPVAADDVLRALARDKKAVGGQIGWVLPRRVGCCQTGVAAPAAAVEETVRAVIAG